MSSSPTIVLNIQASGVGEAITAINQVQAATKKLGNEGSGGLMGSIAGGEMLAHGLEKAAEFVKDFAKESMEMAVHMSEAIEKSQMGGKAFQEFAYAAKFSGASMETITVAMKKLSENVVDGSAELKAYGVDMAALKGKTPEEQFRTLMARMEEIKDPAEKADFAMKAFGRSGEELIPMSAHFKELTSEADQLGVVMKDGAMQCTKDLIEGAKKLWMELQVSFVNSITIIENWALKSWAYAQWMWNSFKMIADNVISNVCTDLYLIPDNILILGKWINNNFSEIMQHLPSVAWDAGVMIAKSLFDAITQGLRGVVCAVYHIFEAIEDRNPEHLKNAFKSFFAVDFWEGIQGNWNKMWDKMEADTNLKRPNFLGLKITEGLDAGFADNDKKLDEAKKKADDLLEKYRKTILNPNNTTGDVSKGAGDTFKLAGAAAYGSAEAYKSISQYNAQTNGVENLQLIEQRKMNDKLDELKSEVAYNTQEGGSGLDAYQFA